MASARAAEGSVRPGARALARRRGGRLTGPAAQMRRTWPNGWIAASLYWNCSVPGFI